MGNCMACMAEPAVLDAEPKKPAQDFSNRGSIAIMPFNQLPEDERTMHQSQSLLGRLTAADVTDRYHLKDVLGRGAFATTRLCVEKSTGREYACKSIHKSRLQGCSLDWADVRRELQVMYHLAGHPGMVQIVDAMEDKHYVHLVMELCTGGELVDRILEKGHYTERDAAAIIRSVLDLVSYAHDMGCVHRDIKPDNLLMADQQDDAPLKLADWGFAAFIKPGQKLQGLAGTCYYVAPEVITGTYDERADVWSCGVLLYVLLSGRPPFCAKKDEDVFRKIVDDGVPNMEGEPWPQISEAAKDAVRRMMTWKAEQRPTAKQILQHEWIREDGVAGDNVIQQEVLHRMKSFAGMNKFKKHAAMVIASHLPTDQIRGLKELFDSMDADGNGTITLDELRKALEARGSRLPADELEALMSVADVNGDGELDYAEFLATTLHSSRLEEEANMLLAFKHFDRDGNGRISADELRDALAAAGDVASVGDVADIISQVDQDGNGEIDYGEFVTMMLSHADGGAFNPGNDGRPKLGIALGVTKSGRVDSGMLRRGESSESGGSAEAPRDTLQPQLP